MVIQLLIILGKLLMLLCEEVLRTSSWRTKGSVVNSTVRALREEIKYIKQGDEITFIEIYNEALAHLIFAGSDIILCSSFRDPSLQIAMKAMKYGSAPVQINFPSDGFRESKVHDIGGSSQHGSTQSEHHEYRNTVLYRFIISTYGDMSLSQALDDIKNDPSQWNWRNMDATAKGLSWDAEWYDIHWEVYSFISATSIEHPKLTLHISIWITIHKDFLSILSHHSNRTSIFHPLYSPLQYCNNIL